jgi:hypothetical protein
MVSAPAAEHVKPIQLRAIAAPAVHVVRVPVPPFKAITPAVAIELVKAPTAVDQVPTRPSSQQVVARLSPQGGLPHAVDPDHLARERDDEGGLCR